MLTHLPSFCLGNSKLFLIWYGPLRTSSTMHGHRYDAKHRYRISIIIVYCWVLVKYKEIPVFQIIPRLNNLSIEHYPKIFEDNNNVCMEVVMNTDPDWHERDLQELRCFTQLFLDELSLCFWRKFEMAVTPAKVQWCKVFLIWR